MALAPTELLPVKKSNRPLLYRCDHCGAKFEKVGSAHRPINSHLFRCPTCGKTTFLASGLIQKKDPVKLTLYCLPAFYQHWLESRVQDYLTKNPWVEINLVCTEEEFELLPQDLSLGVRYGLGDWPEVQLEKLFPHQTQTLGLYLVCRPDQKNHPELLTLWDFLIQQAAVSSY